MTEKLNFFEMVANVEPDANGKFAAVGSVERSRIVAEIANIMKQKAAHDRLSEIYARSKEPQLRQQIDELSPERRAKLNYLINSGVVFDEYN